MREEQRRLAAILAADVAGYSRLMAADESGTLARLKRLRAEVFEPKIAQFHGRIVGSAGDSLLIEFASAVNAVQCAIEVQRELGDQNASLPEERRMAFRMGVNLGDVIAEDGTIHGDGVNVAARLEKLAEPGGVCVGRAIYDQVKGKLAYAYDDLGEQRVHNIPEPVRAYRVRPVKGPADSSPGWPSKDALPLPDKPSIAVLPFENMSGDPEQEYFADGMVEEIITALSRFQDLFVIARNSSFIYKGRAVDVKQVGRELGVRYVLEGSVRKSGNKVRITAQLIDASTSAHLWADHFDGNMEDIFDLQDDVTRNVVGSIAPQIELAEMDRSRKLSASDLSAYQLSLKAQALVYDAIRAGDRSIMEHAVAVANAALELDARNTHALCAQAMAYTYKHLYRWGDDPAKALALARNIVNRLIQIDSSNAKAYMTRAWVHQFHRDYDAAIADYRRAMQLNPNFAMNLFSMAWGESAAGMTADAKEHAHLALRLSPRDNDLWLGEAYLALTQASFAEGEFQEARKWGRLAIQMGAKVPIRRALMIASSGHLGDVETARHHTNALNEFAPRYIPDVLSGAIEVYKMPNHNALLIEGLRKAGL